MDAGRCSAFEAISLAAHNQIALGKVMKTPAKQNLRVVISEPGEIETGNIRINDATADIKEIRMRYFTTEA